MTQATKQSNQDTLFSTIRRMALQATFAWYPIWQKPLSNSSFWMLQNRLWTGLRPAWLRGRPTRALSRKFIVQFGWSQNGCDQVRRRKERD